MKKRLYPITEEIFEIHINPLIKRHYSAAGRPQKISNYQVFCAVLYVLRTGIPWRDLPECYGYWHSIYLLILITLYTITKLKSSCYLPILKYNLTLIIEFKISKIYVV